MSSIDTSVFEKSLISSICLLNVAQLRRHGNITHLCHQLLVIKKRELRTVVSLPSAELFLNLNILLNILEDSTKFRCKHGKQPLLQLQVYISEIINNCKYVQYISKYVNN